MPCVDGCGPDECHGNPAHPVKDSIAYNGTHSRRQAKTHDGQIIDYCVYCLARLKFLHNRWQTDVVIREWP